MAPANTLRQGTDPVGGQVYCGGNFQASSITSAVEKMRLGLQ